MVLEAHKLQMHQLFQNQNRFGGNSFFGGDQNSLQQLFNNPEFLQGIRQRKQQLGQQPDGAETPQPIGGGYDPTGRPPGYKLKPGYNGPSTDRFGNPIGGIQGGPPVGPWVPPGFGGGGFSRLGNPNG